LNKQIISSNDHNWLKQGLANQLGSYISDSLSGPESSENFFVKFQVSLKKFVANWSECSKQEIIICVVVFMQAILP